MMTALIIIHIIICLALVVIVLMQEGKQQGLSGAIAGGAETFFGKNKSRSMDGMLKKITAVLAALFLVCSITLAVVAVNEKKAADAEAQKQIEEMQQEAEAQAEEAPAEAPAEDAEATEDAQTAEDAEAETANN